MEKKAQLINIFVIFLLIKNSFRDAENCGVEGGGGRASGPAVAAPPLQPDAAREAGRGRHRPAVQRVPLQGGREQHDAAGPGQLPPQDTLHTRVESKLTDRAEADQPTPN